MTADRNNQSTDSILEQSPASILDRNTVVIVGGARWYVGVAMLLVLSLILVAGRADAGTAAACEGGGFSLVLPGGTVSGSQKGTIPAGALGESFLVKGKYVEFEVGSATFGIRNYTLTGVPNPLDITGGRRTTIFAGKTPDHRGLTLTDDLVLELKDADIVIERTGPGLSMKIQAKDCAQGGIFQMEPARGDGTVTDITHARAPSGRHRRPHDDGVLL